MNETLLNIGVIAFIIYVVILIVLVISLLRLVSSLRGLIQNFRNISDEVRAMAGDVRQVVDAVGDVTEDVRKIYSYSKEALSTAARERLLELWAGVKAAILSYAGSRRRKKGPSRERSAPKNGRSR